MRTLSTLVAVVVALALAPSAEAAEAVALVLNVDGIEIHGDSTVRSLGRENTIECLSWDQTVGRTSLGTITIRKRIDRSSPSLASAAFAGSVADGTFKFFRPNPSGDGTTQMFYTVRFRGRITSVQSYVPDLLVPATSTQPPLETVVFTVTSVTYTFTSTGTTFTGDAARR